MASTLHAIGCCPLRHGFAVGMIGIGGMFAVAVVLAQEDDGQLVKLRHVHRFVKAADIGRAIAKAHHGDLAVTIVLRGHR